MKILKTRSQLRYTLETAHRVIFEPGGGIGTNPPILPFISGISPASGPIGTPVTISGMKFTGATAVAFGGISASFSVVNDTTITATSPSGTGAQPVTVTTPVGISNSITFTYVALPSAPVLILVSSTSTAVFTIDVDNTIGAGDNVELQVQVTGGSWDLCERANFGGRCVAVSSSIPDLSSIGFSRRVASVRLSATRR